jgi:dipeptidyl aminopeptidase/acylaminoacyl peptidase
MAAFVPAGVPDITLDEVLSIRHVNRPVWAPGGAQLTFLWNDGGLTALWAVDAETGTVHRISNGETSVTAFCWAPDGSRLAYVQGGDIWLAAFAKGTWAEAVPFAQAGGQDGSPAWSPDSRTLGYVRTGQIWLYRFDDHSSRALVLPGQVKPGHQSPAFAFSPDGARIAAIILENGHRDLLIADLNGSVLWRTNTSANECDYAWIDAARLHYTAVEYPMGRHRELFLLDVTSWAATVLVREEAEQGLMAQLAPQVQPGGRGIACVLSADGWPHLHYHDLTSGERCQLTSGHCDDTGYAHDALQFSPDGAWLAYDSNRDVLLTERELWLVSPTTGEHVRLTTLGGTNVNPVWSPDGRRIAFLHADPQRAVDIWITTVGGTPRQLTFSMPESLRPEQFTPPEHVTYPGIGGLDVQADLYLPKGFDATRKYPAIIWVHGGMARQMRHGFHPIQSYAVFHAFHQYLLHKGYVILSVDYRGSIGYGVAYEQATYGTMCVDELDDVVRGAGYLKDLGCVDPDRIGIYGLSYGGYMTLGALTKHPEVFAVGINIAGIWDYAQYQRWLDERYQGGSWHGIARMGGYPGSENQRIWHEASPRNFVAGLTRPLLNLMGTADANVDYQQIDTIIQDCVEHGKDFAVAYYPGESHMFTWRKTWADAFPRIEAAFDRYLRGEGPGRAPRAMI